MLTLTADSASFKAAKRTVLADAETDLENVVREALADYGKLRWYEPILDAAERLFNSTYETESGEQPSEKSRSGLRTALTKSLARTKTPGKNTAAAIQRLVASYSINSAFASAALDDPEELDLEWVTMHDNRVRASHQAADGQTRPMGVPFTIGESELDHPGDTTAPPEEWVGCRCLVRPVKAEAGAMVASGDNSNSTVIVALPASDDPVHKMGPEESHMTILFLGASDQIDENMLAAINGKLMAMTASSEEESYQWPEMTVPVRERGVLGDDDAQVLHLDVDHSWQDARAEMLTDDVIKGLYDSVKQYPQWTPHLTLGYPGEGDIDPNDPAEIRFDRLALWHGDDQFEYPYGGTMTAPAEVKTPTDEQTEPPAPSEATPEDLAIDVVPWYGTIVVEGAPSGDKRQFAKGALRNRPLPLPLTYQHTSAEGHDGNVVVGKILGLSRIEGEGDNPNLINAYGTFLPIEDADKVIGMAAEFGRWGVSIDADDITMEIIEAAEEGGFETLNFTDARIAAACLVSIPAFAEATIQLGEMPEGWMGDTVDDEVEPDAELDPETPGLVAAGAFADVDLTPTSGMKSACNRALDWIKDGKAGSGFESATAERARKIAAGESLTPDHVKRMASYFARHEGDKDADGWNSGEDGHPSAGRVAWDAWGGDAGASWSKSKASALENASVVTLGRGPGWITDPEDTRRIHSYWTTPGQPGYAKIGWGTPGDFNRCRLEIGKYLAESGDSRFLNATCAQWHYDALGEWPGRGNGGKQTHSLDDDYRGSIAIVASGAPGSWTPPASWFAPLQLNRITNTTFVEHPEGTEVYGHLADWTVCHTGMNGVCVLPPRNATNYRLFHNTGGGVMTDNGLVRTGVLTAGGGHASTKLGVRSAMAHYDSTSTAVADVVVGEDQFGIWFHGWVRPSATEQQRHELRAAKLSGDWRMFDGNQELMVACAVNLAGFPTVALEVSYENGEPLGMVAAGMLADEVEPAVATEAVIARAVQAGIVAYKQQEAAAVVAADLHEKHRARHEARVAAQAASIRQRHEGRK